MELKKKSSRALRANRLDINSIRCRFSFIVVVTMRVWFGNVQNMCVRVLREWESHSSSCNRIKYEAREYGELVTVQKKMLVCACVYIFSVAARSNTSTARTCTASLKRSCQCSCERHFAVAVAAWNNVRICISRRRTSTEISFYFKISKSTEQVFGLKATMTPPPSKTILTKKKHVNWVQEVKQMRFFVSFFYRLNKTKNCVLVLGVFKWKKMNILIEICVCMCGFSSTSMEWI